MKAAGLILITASLAIFLTGCDAVRASLGKPTSKDIEALRQQKAQMQRTADSLAIAIENPSQETPAVAQAPEAAPMQLVQVLPEPADEAIEGNEAKPQPEAAKETSEPEPAQAVPEQAEPEPAPQGLADGFYAVIGSFKNESNAQYLYNSISASGTPVEIVKMKNGFTAVMICHGATYDEAYRGMREFYQDKKCPEGIWIYNTAKKLHIEQQ